MNKRCPKCGQTYADRDLNFCLNDGELLAYDGAPARGPGYGGEPPPTRFADDAPPTIMMGNPRETNPTGWSSPSAPAQWQGHHIVTPPGHSPVQYANYTSPNQVLGILSLVLGAMSITVGWCCYTGMLLGPAAMILGIIALIQQKSDPTRYGGRGFAIAGVVLGALYLVGIVLFILLYGAAMFLQI